MGAVRTFEVLGVLCFTSRSHSTHLLLLLYAHPCAGMFAHLRIVCGAVAVLRLPAQHPPPNVVGRPLPAGSKSVRQQAHKLVSNGHFSEPRRPRYPRKLMFGLRETINLHGYPGRSRFEIAQKWLGIGPTTPPVWPVRQLPRPPASDPGHHDRHVAVE